MHCQPVCSTTIPNHVRIVILLLLAVGLSACASIRLATYPSDFVYLERSEITSDMQRMAVEIDRLDRLLQGEAALDVPDRQDRVLASLEEIGRVADRLGGGSAGSNHPLIDNNIDGFRDQVRLARRYAAADPPVYYPAGRLAGQCLACHVQR